MPETFYESQKENLIKALRLREITGGNFRSSNKRFNRGMHIHVVPNLTVANIEKPYGYLCKFTLDGRRLIAFDSSKLKVVVYDYKGVSCAGSLLHSLDPVVLVNGTEYNSPFIRANIFDALFDFKFSTQVVDGLHGEKLCRDFCLMTPDCKHLVLAAAVIRVAEHGAFFAELNRNNESLQLSTAVPLEDITLITVDLSLGLVCDKRNFKMDKISLNQSQGVYIYDRLLSVLSIQHQTIHIFQICKNTGHFIAIQSIGRLLFDDDELIMNPWLNSNETTSSSPFQPASHRKSHVSAEKVMCGLKQRFLAFEYKKAVKEKEVQQSDWSSSDQPIRCPVRLFHAQFDFYKSLKIVKMQMLDSEHFLFRWMPEKGIQGGLDLNASTNASILMVYNWRSTHVIGVYSYDSIQLMDAALLHLDTFRHPDGNVSFPCSLSNCNQAKQLFNRYKKTISNAKGNDPHEVSKRVLSQLPLPAQSFVTSPYLDLSLFSYDEKLISMHERPKLCGDHPVRFFNKYRGDVSFVLHHCGVTGSGVHAGERVLIAFILHPNDPFIISMQRENTHYTLNIHIRAYDLGPDGQNWGNQ